MLVLTSKSRTRGEYVTRPWFTCASGSATEESRGTLRGMVHIPSGRHRAFGSHRTFGCVATISRCATIRRCVTIIVNTLSGDIRAVYGYLLDTKKDSVRSVCNYTNLSCLRLRFDYCSIVSLRCILCVKHSVESSELGIRRRKDERESLNPTQG